MPALTLVKVLFCGQGMCTLVEVYDDGVEKPAADYLALIDCGGGTDWAPIPLTYIEGKVNARTPKHLDYVVISHQDNDHVSMLPALGTRLGNIGATVGTIFLGGLLWGSDAKSSVNKFKDSVGYAGDEVKFTSAEQSHYSTAKKYDELGELSHHGTTYLRLLISRLTLTSGAEDVRKNASSAVVVVENGTYGVVLPGDATFATIAQTCAIPKAGQDLLPQIIGVEIPHHGALRTIVGDYLASGDIEKFDWRTLASFVKVLKAKQAVASAGPYNVHKHPMQEVLLKFYDPLIRVPLHDYVSYSFVGATWDTWVTEGALNCTVEQVGDFANDSKSPRRRVKTSKKNKTPGKPFVYGDVVYKLAAPGLLRPEEMVEFRPRGTVWVGAVGEPVVYAPAP